MGFDSYSTTAGSNTSVAGISIAEGCPASNINDALRQIAADGRTAVNAVQNNTYAFAGTSTGAANTYAATLSPTPTLTTGAATFNLNALGAVAIRKGALGATALGAGDILTGASVSLIYNGTYWLLQGTANLGQMLVGEVKAYAGSTAPGGWLLCYGQAVSRTTYAALFAVVSTTYGTGDGSTTFNVPDMRGRVVAGKDDMGGSNASRLNTFITSNALGQTGGDQNLAAHAHTQQGTFTSGGVSANHTHSWTLYGGSDDLNFNSGSPGSSDTPSAIGTGTSGVNSVSHTHNTTISGSTASAGAGAGGNVQPTIILNYLIFAGV
jgi:microcystin-dependent protein